MEKIIFFGLVIPIFAFVLYLGGSAIMKGMSAKNEIKANENNEDNNPSQPYESEKLSSFLESYVSQFCVDFACKPFHVNRWVSKGVG